MKLSRERCLLLLIDLQKAFISADGDLAKRGRDISQMQQAAKYCDHLARKARSCSIPVVWTRMMVRYDYADGGKMITDLLPHLKTSGALRRGTPDVEIDSTLHVADDDEVMDKPRNSAWIGTSLEVYLKSRQIENIIVGGVTTSMCVDTTVRDLGQRDYATFVVKQAVADFDQARHEAALSIMSFGFARVIDLNDCVAAIEGKGIDF